MVGRFHRQDEMGVHACGLGSKQMGFTRRIV